MNSKKIILYAAIGIFILFLVLGSSGMMGFNNTRKISGNSNSITNGNMPEECQKPEGQSLEQWKEHLGHHENTLYCLDYYK